MDTPDQARWAIRYFGDAYRQDVYGWNQHIGGDPDNIRYNQSCMKETGELYNPERTYATLDSYETVKALFDEAEAALDTIHVLCSGSLTEQANEKKYQEWSRRIHDELLRTCRAAAK
jgi:hypothetical protein